MLENEKNRNSVTTISTMKLTAKRGKRDLEYSCALLCLFRIFLNGCNIVPFA